VTTAPSTLVLCFPPSFGYPSRPSLPKRRCFSFDRRNRSTTCFLSSTAGSCGVKAYARRTHHRPPALQSCSRKRKLSSPLPPGRVAVLHCQSRTSDLGFQPNWNCSQTIRILPLSQHCTWSFWVIADLAFVLSSCLCHPLSPHNNSHTTSLRPFRPSITHGRRHHLCSRRERPGTSISTSQHSTTAPS